MSCALTQRTWTETSRGGSDLQRKFSYSLDPAVYSSPDTQHKVWGWVNMRRLHAQLSNYTSLTHDTEPIRIMRLYWANEGGGSSGEHIVRQQCATDWYKRIKKPQITIAEGELTDQFSGLEEDCLAWENSSINIFCGSGGFLKSKNITPSRGHTSYLGLRVETNVYLTERLRYKLGAGTKTCTRNSLTKRRHWVAL